MDEIPLSVVIPARNEAENIAATLLPLQAMRQRGQEVIVIDGQSRDDTAKRAQPLADRILIGAPGRARQMNAGADIARGKALWFLHADTRVPEDADRMLLRALAGGHAWGRFDVRLSGRRSIFLLVAGMMNLRSRLTGIATGDQGIFVRRTAFDALGGFPELPLMEDIEISRRLKAFAGRPACLGATLLTSSRRWEENGAAQTILLMWGLRLAFALGVRPSTLAGWYGGIPGKMDRMDSSANR